MWFVWLPRSYVVHATRRVRYLDTQTPRGPGTRITHSIWIHNPLSKWSLSIPSQVPRARLTVTSISRPGRQIGTFCGDNPGQQEVKRSPEVERWRQRKMRLKRGGEIPNIGRSPLALASRERAIITLQITSSVDILLGVMPPDNSKHIITSRGCGSGTRYMFFWRAHKRTDFVRWKTWIWPISKFSRATKIKCFKWGNVFQQCVLTSRPHDQSPFYGMCMIIHYSIKTLYTYNSWNNNK